MSLTTMITCIKDLLFRHCTKSSCNNDDDDGGGGGDAAIHQSYSFVQVLH